VKDQSLGTKAKPSVIARHEACLPQAGNLKALVGLRLRPKNKAERIKRYAIPLLSGGSRG